MRAEVERLRKCDKAKDRRITALTLELEKCKPDRDSFNRKIRECEELKEERDTIMRWVSRVVPKLADRQDVPKFPFEVPPRTDDPYWDSVDTDRIVKLALTMPQYEPAPFASTGPRVVMKKKGDKDESKKEDDGASGT